MLRILKLIVPFALFLIILSACGEEYEGDFSYKVKDFTFTDQTGEKISKDDFTGSFWVADFVFTNCETVCPPMTSNMVRLQNQLSDAGLNDVQLASFSVDPKRDTPEALTEFAKSRGATNLDNWHLFTGYDFDTIKEFSIKSFKSALEKVPDSDQFMHATSFFLVSPEGNAIKRYDGRKPGDMKKIVQDIKDMQ
ncbi:SCO family protein [Lentibacillus sp. Marseille-P4043]|uniref:SCO family protein n=1 Tax=Lentibacillus sp. Marseille-P4043 TaxID=2040293 RepID=UPI000D0B56C9|nr:SCO family protein [Lentibacillus sp. Marseille-P4043]